MPRVLGDVKSLHHDSFVSVLILFAAKSVSFRHRQWWQRSGHNLSRIGLKVRKLGKVSRGGFWFGSFVSPILCHPVSAAFVLSSANDTVTMWSMSTMVDNYLSVNEAAKFLKISVGRVRQLLGSHENNRIHGFKINKRAWMIPKEELEKYKNELKNKPKRAS